MVFLVPAEAGFDLSCLGFDAACRTELPFFALDVEPEMAGFVERWFAPLAAPLLTLTAITLHLRLLLPCPEFVLVEFGDDEVELPFVAEV